MAKKKKHKHNEEEGGEAWLLPYSDLMTLLLAVFIVLFAVSKVDETKAEKMAEAFRNSIMVGSEGPFSKDGNAIVSLYPKEQDEDTSHEDNHKTNESEAETEQEDTTTQEDTTQENITPEETPPDVAPEKDTNSTQNNTNISQEELEKFLGEYEYDNLDELKSELEVISKKEDMSSEMRTSIDKRGLVISLSNAALFKSGSADIKNENKDTLLKIANIINRMDNYIRIEGHTDNFPISSALYPSNWELSTARATSVVRLLVDECNVSPEKVMAVGYGEFKPIADNSTDEGRARNRRIDVIVLSEKYNNLESKVSSQ